MTARKEQLPYAELYHRLRKALALADMLDAANITSAELQLGAEDQWAEVAKLSEPPYPPPSEETQKLVVELIAAREKARARMVRK